MLFTVLAPVKAVVINLIDDNVNIIVRNTVSSAVLLGDTDVTTSSELLLRPAPDLSPSILADTCT